MAPRRGHFPALELILSVAGHGLLVGTVLLFEAWFSPEVEAADMKDEGPQVVYVTQVKLTKKAARLPDKASQKPREEAPVAESSPVESSVAPTRPQESAPREAPPRSETSQDSPSLDDLLADLPTMDLPEGPVDREETSAEGSSQAVLDGADFGADSPVGRWMAECGEAMRRVIFVADHVTSGMDDAAYVIVKVDIDEDGLVTHPALHQTSGSTLFDRAIVNGLKRRPNCPPRPPEALEFSQRTRIRVPVRESD